MYSATEQWLAENPGYYTPGIQDIPIDAPNVSDLPPLATLPGKWEVTGTASNWDLHFPGSGAEKDKQTLVLLMIMGIFGVMILKQ